MIQRELIQEVVTRFREYPTTTLTQFTNYIGAKPWYQQATVNYFMYKTAIGLAEHHGITLSDYTNNTIFIQVRNWIANATDAQIKRIIFNE